MVNAEIRLIIFFEVKGGEALYYNQQKQDRELTVAQIMSSLLQIQTEIEEIRGKHQAINIWPKSNPLWSYSGQGIRSDRVPEELWMEVHDIIQEVVIKTMAKKKKWKKVKWLSEKDLQIAKKRREVKRKG